MPDKKLPIVAVIMPLYNHKEYVKQAIDSVVRQDYPNKVVVVSDDGSSDGSLEVVFPLLGKSAVRLQDNLWIGKHSQCDVPVYVLRHNTPSGPSAARNRAIKLLWDRAHLFCMCDADDYYLPAKISRSMVKFLDDPERIGLVYSDVLIYNQRHNTFINEFREPYNDLRLCQECIISNTSMVSRRALHEVGLFDETMRTAEDWNLYLRITQYFMAIHIAEPLSVYRVTGKNASDIVDKGIWNNNWKKIADYVQNERGVL